MRVGIDIGSITTKIAVMERNRLLTTEVVFTGYDVGKAWTGLLESVLGRLGRRQEEIEGLVSTGYGRESVSVAHKKVTEITCHAEGAKYLYPKVRSVVDIGGQDSKCIRIGGDGSVADFVMNDKCAAGTGRFLEVMARAMGVDLEEFGRMSKRASRPVRISSMCTVFAESEVISLVAKGARREDIIAGIHESIAARTASMARNINIAKPVVMTGGVSKNVGMRDALSKALGVKLEVPEHAQVCGAIGAAILANGANNPSRLTDHESRNSK